MPRGPSSRAATWVNMDNPAWPRSRRSCRWRAGAFSDQRHHRPALAQVPAGVLSTRKAPSGTSTTGAGKVGDHPKPAEPAQLTTTSGGDGRRPPVEQRGDRSSSVTSTPAQVCGSPSSPARWAARSPLRSAIVTRQPSAASNCAVAQPIPDAPPTTTASLFAHAVLRSALGAPIYGAPLPMGWRTGRAAGGRATGV